MNVKQNNRESGFTLVEIAIVLVIIGLLLGGILKGQELINSARVRNLADMNAGIQAAYYGFIDRYRQVPGDIDASKAQEAIGVAINGGGNQNGRLDGTSATDGWTESAAVWEHLSKAGFISGEYDGNATTAAEYRDQAPTNAFNGPVILFRTQDYSGVATPPVRLSLVMGQNIPVNIARELDVKLDDGEPETGVARMTLATGTVGAIDFSDLDTGAGECTSGPTNDVIWDIAANSQDCNMIFLY